MWFCDCFSIKDYVGTYQPLNPLQAKWPTELAPIPGFCPVLVLSGRESLTPPAWDTNPLQVVGIYLSTPEGKKAALL